MEPPAHIETLSRELQNLQKVGNLKKSLQDVDKIIEQLERARESIIHDPVNTSITLAKLQNPIKSGFDRVNDDLREINKGHKEYARALDIVEHKAFNKRIATNSKEVTSIKPLGTEYDAIASHPSLINRAVAMHFLREGDFDVAGTFLAEARENPPRPAPTIGTPNPYTHDEADFTSLKSQELQARFQNMYDILDQLKVRNLHSAIEWARHNSQELEQRGSNLEFELNKLQYVWLFLGPTINGLPNDTDNGVLAALNYAKQNFAPFQGRHSKEIQQLITAVAYQSNLLASPYKHIFDIRSAWSEVSNGFTREFCSLLGLSAESPLYIAATAGAIALPALLKLASIVKEKRTEWTTQTEMPVETILPRSMIFHAIFVCPVSKEQATESNPPMMMPCGHVVAKETLYRLSKNHGRFKCPYCPAESQPKEARQVHM